MTHLQIYNSIINTAKSKNRKKHKGIYFETHYINPRFNGGDDNKDNLVLLTAKEHFICHKLLMFIYDFNELAIYSFHRMCHSVNGDHITSSRDFEYARILVFDAMSKSRKGKGNPMFGRKLSNETKMKLSKSSTGIKHTIETKEQLRLSKLGDKNPMFSKISPNKGKTYSFTEQQRKNLSESMKGKSPKVNSVKKECEYCHKIFTLPCYSRWHGEKCKLK